ncbi:hypothetical protein ACFL6C_11375 [Myxococcota bacterium]
MQLELLHTVSEEDDLLILLLDRHRSDGLEGFPSSGASPLGSEQCGFDEERANDGQVFSARHTLIMAEMVTTGLKLDSKNWAIFQAGGWSDGPMVACPHHRVSE